MNYEEAKKVIIKKMKSLAPVHNIHQVFRDFTTLAACTISNSIDKEQWQKREDLYIRTVKRYTKEEADLFGEMLGALTLGLDYKMGDLLGEVYMQLEISNDDAGQFFTPYHIAELMAETTIEESIKEIKEKGYITVNDPAVGGGVTVIAMASALKKRDYNYQKCMKVYCEDIDHDLVRLCYVQLSLLGIDAVVTQGDTIAYKFNEIYYTPIHVLNKIEEIKRRKSNKELESMIEKVRKTVKLEVEPKEKKVEVVPGQINIFDLGVL